MRTSNAIDLYLGQIKKQTYHLSPAEDFISSLQVELNDYYLEYPDCTVEDLIEQFGTPEDVAGEFLEGCSKKIEPKTFSQSNKRLKILIIVLAVLLAVSIAIVIKAMQPMHLPPAEEVNIIDKTQDH